jgi:hypothetical protein
MKSAALLLIPLALCFAAGPAQEAAGAVTEMVGSLTAGNVQQFMAAFDPALPGYQKLRENVDALVRQGETQSYVDILKNEGDEKSRTLELTWELRIQHAGDATASARREVQVTAKLQKQGKGWRIVALDPIAFLAP